MFDKLVESEPAGADFRNRRRYFMVSSVVVGVLFTTAVIISIYAADYGLGSTSFELTEMLAPVDMAAADPEPLRQRMPPATSNQSQSQPSTRLANMASVNEPTIVPTTVSTAKNAQMARQENGYYKLANFDSDPINSGGSGRNTGSGPVNSGGLSAPSGPIAADNTDVDPPPVKLDPPPARPTTIKSLGVVNGKAEYLAKPAYSATAKSVGAQGQVNVQVMIDEEGRVISAKAVDGNPLLRPAAEQAARNSKFSPTLLSKVPVKVTGMIVYNFVR